MQVRDIPRNSIRMIIYRGRELRYHGDDRWFLAMHATRAVQRISGGFIGNGFYIAQSPRQDAVAAGMSASSAGLGFLGQLTKE